MSLAALITALQAAGIRPTGREVAEALWLAQHLAAPDVPETEPRPPQEPTEAGDGQAFDLSPVSTQPAAEPVQLSMTTVTPSGSRVRGHPVRVPGIPGLSRRQDVMRAFRPLRRFGPSRRHRVIDEDATASFIASTGLWTAVTRPATERWFDAVLVIDSSSSMDLWRPLASDLRAVLSGTGAFRDVRTWRLETRDRAVVLPPARESAPRSPRELIDSAGRRLFLVVTDGAARGWHDGSAASALCDWSKTGPVAILQPLPEQMWHRTGLAVVPARVSARTVGTLNNQLRADYRSRRRHRLPGTPIPVLGMEPETLHSWSRLVTGSAFSVPLAVASVNDDRPALTSPVGQDEPGAAVDRFRASASPEAYRLAVCLSAVPLTLPIMRLVQHVVAPASNLSALAEVILGGLISRTGDSIYEFLPGTRDALLEKLRRSEMTAVYSAISDYISEHADGASQTFAAIAEMTDGPIAADAEAFSWVPPAVAARLGLPHMPTHHHEDQSLGLTGPPNTDLENDRPERRSEIDPVNLLVRLAQAPLAEPQLTSSATDPYQALKAYLLRKYGHDVAASLAELERQPSSSEAQDHLAELLYRMGAREDPDLLQHARPLAEMFEGRRQEESGGGAQRFASDLRQLRIRAGSPSYSTLERVSRHQLRRSTMADILNGNRVNIPDWRFVAAFVEACRSTAAESGLDADNLGSLADWKRHWDSATTGVIDARFPSDGQSVRIGQDRLEAAKRAEGIRAVGQLLDAHADQLIAVRSRYPVEDAQLLSSRVASAPNVPVEVKTQISTLHDRIRGIIQQVARDIEGGKYAAAEQATQALQRANERERAVRLVQADKAVHVSFESLRLAITFFSDINQTMLKQIEQAPSGQLLIQMVFSNAIMIYELADFIVDFVASFTLDGAAELDELHQEMLSRIAQAHQDQERLAASAKRDGIEPTVRDGVLGDIGQRRAALDFFRDEWERYAALVKQLHAQVEEVQNKVPVLELIRENASAQVDALELVSMVRFLRWSADAVRAPAERLQAFQLAPLTPGTVRRLLGP